jgi:transcriptional regulator with XRE-family HTH domain
MKGLNIKEFLAREGVRLGIRTQEDLAARLGVSDQTISNWVKGKTFPTHQMEWQLYEMGMTTEEMFGKAYPSTTKVEGQMDRMVKASLMRLMENLNR